jgi:hypothetical protein
MAGLIDILVIIAIPTIQRPIISLTTAAPGARISVQILNTPYYQTITE